jgi:AbrB family looped-hinge helix DNA binding protein
VGLLRLALDRHRSSEFDGIPRSPYSESGLLNPEVLLTMKRTPAQERIGRVGQRRQVVIPREIFETLKLQAGDLVAFAEQKNGVLIKPKRKVDPDDTLSPAEAKIVRRGEAQLKRGESKSWRAVKHAPSR